jgi:hypothetical protein
MLTTLFAVVAMLLTLALPTFPEGLTIAILGFLGLVGLAGFGGFFRSAAARKELALLSPWLVALGLGLMVGIVRGNPMGQALEDALCYMLFVLGLCAGRGASRPTWLLWVVLAVCVIDVAISLVRMPSYDLSRYRSTYLHFKVILGHPLVGLFCAALLRHLARGRLQRGALTAVIAFLALGVVATVSRGMVLGMVLGVLTWLYVRKPARGFIYGAIAAVLVAAFAATLFELGQQYLRLGNQATVDGRVREIGECLAYFARMPVFGAGLGAEFVIDGFVVSYVHNMLAYHLWKFGLVGSALFALPLIGLARQALRIDRETRALVFAGAAMSLVYMVTAASYKNYIVVPMIGLTVGAAFRMTLPPPAPALKPSGVPA